MAYLRFVLCFFLGVSWGAWGHPGIGDRIHQLNDAIASRPDNQYLYIQRSLAHSENANPEQAMRDIVRASELGDVLNAAFVHGVLLYRAGSFSDANHYFDQYLAAHPQHLDSLEYRARLLRDAGQNKAALDDFLRIFTLNPTPNPGLYISAADLMVSLPSHGVAAAVELLEVGMTKIGAVPQLQRHAIALEKGRANYSAAIRRMNLLAPALRKTPQWKIEQAQLFLLNIERQKAELLLQAADSQLSNMPRNGILDEARANLQRLKEQLSSNAATSHVPP